MTRLIQKARTMKALRNPEVMASRAGSVFITCLEDLGSTFEKFLFATQSTDKKREVSTLTSNRTCCLFSNCFSQRDKKNLNTKAKKNCKKLSICSSSSSFHLMLPNKLHLHVCNLVFNYHFVAIIFARRPKQAETFC